MYTTSIFHSLNRSLRYITLSLLLSVGLSMLATPKLTVVVTVDGLTHDNLQQLQPYWPAGGLRTMSEESCVSVLTFPHPVYGGLETLATLMTGTTPSHHSIESDWFFSRQDRALHSVFEDKQASGIGTKQTLSARQLPTVTLTDEWRLKYGSDAKIYAIGIDGKATTLLAGHAANACCWLDADSLRWVSTSYYPLGLPSAADAMNMSGRIQELAQTTWEPRMDISMYNHPTQDELKRPFSKAQYTDIHHCPSANTLVVELALSLQQVAQLGQGAEPDILCIQLNTIPPSADSDDIESAMHEDLYLRLNQDLGYLMEQLERRLGRSQIQLFLLSRPALGHSTHTMNAIGIPVNRFNVDRAAALTGAYLMAIYGHERWVDGGYGPYIFLNRTLIEQRRLSLETIQRQVANFLMDFEGVEVAFPIHEAMLTADQAYIYRKHAGDVYFRLQDNWVLYGSGDKTLDYVIQPHPTGIFMMWTGTMRTCPESVLDATKVKDLILQ